MSTIQRPSHVPLSGKISHVVSCSFAETAGWRQQALEAITALEQPDQDTERAGVLLLTDMRDLFTTRSTDRLFSKDIAEALAEMEEHSWPEWQKEKLITVRQIARYEIRPKQIRIDQESGKGYLKDECQEAFETYLPPEAPLIHPKHRNKLVMTPMYTIIHEPVGPGETCRTGGTGARHWRDPRRDEQSRDPGGVRPATEP